MKKLFLIPMLALMWTLSHCQAPNNTLTLAEMNRVKKLDTLLAAYPSQPGYYINYSNSACLFEVRINKHVVDKMYDAESTGGTLTTINTALLKSGKQKVWVRLTPFPGQTFIKSNEPFTLRIGFKNMMDPIVNNTPRPWTWVWEMPPVPMPEEGLPYYEFEGEFEAVVPYQITRWSNCIDLRNIPDIEKRVVAKFNEVKQLMLNRDTFSINTVILNRDVDVATSLYLSSKEFEDRRTKFNNGILNAVSTKDAQEIEDYNLVFSCDGRMVTLESRKNGGYPSALLWLKEEEGSIDFHYYLLYLGIREGGTELEIL